MNNLKIIYPFLLVFTLIGCSKLEDPDLIPEEEQLQLFSSKDSLIADGKDIAFVFARLPYDAGKLDINFTTTKGLFNQVGAKTIKQTADSIAGEYRFSKVILQSDTSKGEVTITAEVATTNVSRKRLIIKFN